MTSRPEPSRRRSREDEPRRSRRDEAPAKRRASREEEPTRRRRRSRDEDEAPRRRARRDDDAPKRSSRAARSSRSRNKEPVTEGLRPIRNKLSKAEMYEALAERASEASGSEYTKKDAKVMLEAFEAMIMASIMPRSAGAFTWSGICKFASKHIEAKRVPARKASDINPFTGEEYGEAKPAHTKPATTKVKILSQKKLKLAVLGE